MESMDELASKLLASGVNRPVTNDWLRRHELPVQHGRLWEGFDCLFAS